MNPHTLSSSSQNESVTASIYDQYVIKNYNRAALTLVRGEGSHVWDDRGRRFLDFTSGIAVTALGHGHPHWVEAIRRQAGELVHVSNLFRNPLQGELAMRLTRKAGPGRVLFCNSGAEANETLLKLARLHGVRKAGEEGKCIGVICAEDAFHGRTFGGMSATPQDKIQKGFRPLLSGFSFGRLNDLESFERLIDSNTAAIFLETIQGESGVLPCHPEFLVGIRQLCDKHDLLLILDEVQCGIGRTGRFFAFEHSGIRPDAIGMAKGLGGGFPIGAIWAGEKAADLFTPGSHGTTFGGTPLACAAALAVLDVLDEEGVLERVRENGAHLLEQLEGLGRRYPDQLEGVRGLGYMVGLQLKSDPVPVLVSLREKGLLALSAGGNVVRLLPPLTVSRAELDEAVALIAGVLAELAA
ncbi:MAG: acetylornithine aminotransferase [Verrucomicrobia bacterium]|nr:MAG: acetylornithine aminotransferase [Verrucomicrobiota bacterium]